MYVFGDAIASWLHFVLIFALVAALTAQLVLFRYPLAPGVIERLSRFDLAYGLSALALLLVGFGRATGFAKGWAFYAGQPWFWVKIAAFAGVGALSIVPTMQLARWRRELRRGAHPVVDEATVKRMRRFVHAELSLLPLIALAAVLMARDMRL